MLAIKDNMRLFINPGMACFGVNLTPLIPLSLKRRGGKNIREGLSPLLNVPYGL